MKVVHTIKDLQAELTALRAQGKKVGLVPTMGALHAGHASLVKRSVSENGVTVVSVFVNPTQFNDKNDLEKYPRTLDADCCLLEECGAAFVFAPSVSEMYPEPDTRQFSYAPLDTVMEGAFRPGHFNGVCQIVSKLFDAVTGDFKKLLHNEETKWYTAIVLGATLLVITGLYITDQNGSFEDTFRRSLFLVVTIATSTGYTGDDYVAWGPFFTTIFLLLMFFGACAGSTCGGAKIDRLVVLAKNTKNELYRVIHPNAILPVRVNGKAISHEIVSKILAFILVYVMVLIAGSIILSALGLSMEESFGSTLSCLSNIGPGAGSTGPAGNYAFIPDLGKWTLSIIMLIGRLELFTVLILFTSYFWKNS